MKTNSAGDTFAENLVNPLFRALSPAISSRFDNVRSILALKVSVGPSVPLSHFSSWIADGVRRKSTSSQQYNIEARFWKVRPRFESNSMWLPNPPLMEMYFTSSSFTYSANGEAIACNFSEESSVVHLDAADYCREGVPAALRLIPSCTRWKTSRSEVGVRARYSTRVPSAVIRTPL